MNQTYTRGTPAAQVPPDARGITWTEWHNRLMEEIWKQAAEVRKTAPPNEKLMGQKIWQPRDSYGL